jgi:uncharacterized protein (TIRG00374 family)
MTTKIEAPGSDGSALTRPFDRRRVLAGTIVGIPVSVVFLYLASRGVDFDQVKETFASASPSRVAAAIIALLLGAATQAERWRVIARRQGPVTRRLCTVLVAAGIAVNNVVPGRPGELLRGYWLGRAIRVPVARAFSTVVVDRAADVLFLVSVLTITFVFLDHPRWLENLVILALVGGLVLGGLLLLARWYSHHSHRGRDRAHLGVGERSFLRRQASGLVRGVATALDPRDLPRIVGLTAVAWSFWAAGAWLVASSLGISLSPLEVAFTTAVINLGTAIPASPGFVGTYQWLAVAALGMFSVSRTDAFAFSILLQAAWYVPTTLIGVGLAGWRILSGSHARLSAVPVSPPRRRGGETARTEPW